MRAAPWPFAVAVLAMMVIGQAMARLHAAQDGIVRESRNVDHIPVTIFRPAIAGRTPVVVIAHGFAGSQQLMQSFALAFARNGYVAVTFDFAGHARNPLPMTGDVTSVTGTTRVLVAELGRVAVAARDLGDGRLAVLGHSMASDIVVRFAEEAPDVDATIAVSMFSPAVTPTAPRNLLVIVGDWERMLKREALRAVGLAIAPERARPGVTYGRFEDGTARRVAFSPGVEHVGVLYSGDSLREAVDWLDQVFGRVRGGPPRFDARGPAILQLLLGAVAVAWPLSFLLPRVAVTPVGAALAWRRLLLPALVPMFATPLILRVVPTHFLPVVVGDYLAVHFLVYGLVTAAVLRWVRRAKVAPAIDNGQASLGRLAIATLAIIAFFLVGIVWPINTAFTSFVPGGQRLPLVAVMLVGTLSYFASDEWLTRGDGAPRGAYAATKLAFAISLLIAVALDFRRLFFLILIVPLILMFFVVHGLFSRWSYARTGHPLAAGIANALACAWAIAATFPLLAG